MTGALSVTTSVRDSVSVVHGPAGCAHHNFSLLHTIALDQDRLPVPRLVSSGMLDTEVVFGGEDALRRAIHSAASQGTSSVFVLSSCIAETIGDDVAAVCSEEWEIPVIRVPTAGFLGGSFQNGVNNALSAIAGMAPLCTGERYDRGVNIIGEKNLEYEVEENYSEVSRLLALLGLTVNIRFVRQITTADVEKLGSAAFNVLREDGMGCVGADLAAKFNTPVIGAFPAGLSGTIAFLEQAGRVCGIDSGEAVARERDLQQSVISDFSDISRTCIAPGPATGAETSLPVLREVAGLLQVKIRSQGACVPMPFAPPVGTTGVKRMLHRWRRALHA